MRPDLEPSVEERLRSFEAVTDAALDWLDLDDLLEELLDRVRVIADADTAVVLLHEEESGELVVAATLGVDGVVEGAVRVPVGVGFAGQIAKSRQPVFVAESGVGDAAPPPLGDDQTQVLLGVPLLAGGLVIGVLYVGRRSRQPFNEHDGEVLQIVARWLAGAVQGRQLASERAALTLIERGLRPGRFPYCPGLETASRYLPSDNRIAGGDWYDVFRLPSNELWIVTADVAGHGLDAAVVMGRVRSALRSYALLDLSPAEVLELTDRKVQHFEIGAMVTVLCAATSEPFDELRVASAGHPPPVVAEPGRPARFVDLGDPEPPLGTLPGIRRTNTTVSFPPGALLLTYTDGLVERRNEPLDQGLERLRSVVEPRHPEVVCSEVIQQLHAWGEADDDIAMVAIRRAAPPG